MTTMNNYNFNDFCHKVCDGLYDPLFSYDEQCTGYKMLRRMVSECITPASIEEAIRWETDPTRDELLTAPDIKYLRFLHPNLRTLVIENWEMIKTLDL